MSGALDVLGVAVWTPEFPDLQHFLARSPAPTSRPAAELLNARARGRASPLTSMFANVVERATAAAGVDRRTLPSLYGSAYGEMATTLTLLEQLHGEDGRLSPAKFQASVHNTASGLLSIAQANRSFSSAVAAGHDTPAMLLIEAWAWLSQHPGAVLAACADEQAPAPLVAEPGYGALAVGLVLSNRAPAGASLARLLCPVRARAAPLAGANRDNPCAGALALVTAVFGEAPSSVILNGAAEQSWLIQVQPAVRVP